MDGEVFLAYVEQLLAPSLQPGDTVIMDNLPAPRVSGVREAIEQKQWAEVEPQMKTAAAAIDAPRLQVEAATRLLEGK